MTERATDETGYPNAVPEWVSATLPETMAVIEIGEPGGPEALVPTMRPVPQPGPGEVLVRVAAAGVNRPDVMQRRGLYPPPPGASDLPGLEISGTVVALGEGVTRWRRGDRVCALLAGGGYAEYAAAPEGQCLPVPEGVSLEDAASLPETYFTVWSNLFERGYAAPGETVLVHGGTSGIGTTAIQLCRAFGLNVIVTCGSDEKCRIAEEIGANAAINYRTEDFAERVLQLTDGRGVDVVLDMIGGDYVPRNLSVLANDGRHVSIAIQRGNRVEIKLFDIMTRRLVLTGSTLRARSVAFKAALAQSLEREVWPLFAEGKLKPVIDSRFSLRDAAKAHARMEESAHVGKIVLRMGPKG